MRGAAEFEFAASSHNALCTCFFEKLMNHVPETIATSRLVACLGPKARCGIRTEGLW